MSARATRRGCFILSNLICRAGLPSPGPELVLWDAGLGAATNALAALQTHRVASGRARPMRIISFENDLSGLALAYENRSQFPYFGGFESAVAELLEKGQWQDENAGLSWQVIRGEFHDHAAATPSPEIIYYDFYSPKTSPHLWTVPTFELIAALAGRRAATEPIFTPTAPPPGFASRFWPRAFSWATAEAPAPSSRPRTGPSTRLSALERPLDARWLERLERFGRIRFPTSGTSQRRVSFSRRSSRILSSAN